MNTLPPEFVAMLAGEPAFDGLAAALAGTPPDPAVRLHARRGLALPAGADPVPWCDRGFYLARRPAFTFDPAMYQGLYYVQDPSSMIMQHVVSRLTQGVDAPLLFLDACAAPGGKTTAAIDALPPGSLIVANEYDNSRIGALAENLRRWGYGTTAVTRGDTARLAALDQWFDIIAVDAPCSGEGMMRKHEQAISQWSPALTRSCAALQREILQNVWPALKPGGYLIYSTCTFNRLENEDNVRWMTTALGAVCTNLALDSLPGVMPSLDNGIPAGRFLPGRVRGEGLFMAVVRKPGDGFATPHATPRPKAKAKDRAKAFDLSSILDGAYRGTIDDAGRVHALPAQWQAHMQALAKATGVVSAGIAAGTVKGRDFIPSQALATALDLKRGRWPEYAVSYPQAIAFLRGLPLNLADGAPRGITLLTYGNMPLGWVKNLGNRANNLMPQVSRILSPQVPEKPPVIL